MRLGNSNPNFKRTEEGDTVALEVKDSVLTEEGDTIALEVSSIKKDLGVHMDNKLAFKDHVHSKDCKQGKSTYRHDPKVISIHGYGYVQVTVHL